MRFSFFNCVIAIYFKYHFAGALSLFSLFFIQTTQKLQEEGRQLTEEQIRYVISALNNALVFLHEKDIAHRL